ncbi:MAG: MBL fold metallo-hydrolase, partial [Acidimicrobiales bacterium]|nr:MBL fold metallo-hydrolase [Acidimicrobiales bacterium]
MATDLLALSHAVLHEGRRGSQRHPMAARNELCEVGDGTAMVSSFANVAALTTGAGLVLVDTGHAFSAATIRAAVREWTDEPFHTAIYTHGHVDHVTGTPAFDAENVEQGRPRAEVLAQEQVDPRFD